MAVRIPAVWFWGIVAAAWIGAAVHTGLAMRRYGRRWWAWVLISLCFSVLPAAIVSYVDYFRQLRRHRQAGGARRVTRCPHCGAVLACEQVRRVGGHDVCPRCGMVMGEETRA